MKAQLSTTALLVLSLLTPAAGRQPAPQQKEKSSPPQEDVLRIDTNLVQVDVVVTDKNGRQVIDLRPEDFEVFEDGKRREITNFSYLTAGAPPPAQAAAAGTAPPPPGTPAGGGAPVMPARLGREQVRRTIAVVVDDLGISFESMASVRQALRKFVDEQVQPHDLVAILRTSSGVGAWQQFTSDRRELAAAAGRVRWYPSGRGNASTGPHAPARDVADDFTDGPELTEEAEASRAGVYAAGTLNSVRSVVEGLSELPGRKSVVFISEAFRLFSAEGRNERLLEAMRRLTDEANAASVTIYTLDASGLQTLTGTAEDKAGGVTYTFDPQMLAAVGYAGPLAPAARPPLSIARADTLSAQAERDSGAAFKKLNSMMDRRRTANAEAQTVLSYLAQRTGGLFVRNRNDLGEGMGQLMADQGGFYLIGYRPDQPAVEGGRRRFHRLTVKVKGADLKVRARDGYLGITDAARPAAPPTREDQLRAALLSPFASPGVRMRLTPLFGLDPEGNPYLRSLLHVDARDLTFGEEAEGKRRAGLEIVGVAFDEEGGAADQFSYTQPALAAGEDAYRRLLQDGLTYILNFPIKRPGAYQLRVAVRDSSSGQIGTSRQFVEVPDLGKKRLALSGIVLGAAASPAQGAEAPAPAAAGKAEGESDPQAGPAVRRLRQGMILDYRYNIFNAQPDPAGRPQVETQMRLLREGRPVFTGKRLTLDAARQPDAKRLNAGGRLRIGPELTPGEYVLQVFVADALAPKGKRTTTQWIDFEIVN